MGENKYSKGQIYKIVSPDFSKCYIGSTCEGLSTRMARHRYMFNQHIKRGKESYRCVNKLFEKFGVENCKMLWIEDYPCNSKKELRAREGFYQQSIDCINKKIEGRTDKEYREQNKEKEQERHKTYYENNKDKRKAYNEANKEKRRQYNKEYREKNKAKLQAQKRQYREMNKERIKERYKAYHEKNKEEINRKLREKRQLQKQQEQE